MDKLKRYKELVLKGAEATEAEKEELATLETELGTEAVEEEVEVSDEVVSKIASGVMEKVQKQLDEKIAASEKTITKNIVVPTKSETEEVTKEVNLVRWLKAVQRNDQVAMKAAVHGNETTDEDGGFLVPPAEFVAEIRRLEQTYGVAARNANLRNITVGNSAMVTKKTAGLSFYETSELQAGRLTKMTMTQIDVTLRKFLAFAPVSNELDEDSAINIWNELTREFALALTKLQDQLVFTDATVGITNTVGVPTRSIGSTLLSYDDLNFLTFAVPEQAQANAKFYFHRQTLGILQRLKDKNGVYLLNQDAKSLWGYPYELTAVLSDPSQGESDKPLVVFGDLKYFDLIQKAGLGMELLTEATIGGRDGDETINLASQDAKALRARTRMNGMLTFANAVAMIKGNGLIS